MKEIKSSSNYKNADKMFAKPMKYTKLVVQVLQVGWKVLYTTVCLQSLLKIIIIYNIVGLLLKSRNKFLSRGNWINEQCLIIRFHPVIWMRLKKYYLRINVLEKVEPILIEFYPSILRKIMLTKIPQICPNLTVIICVPCQFC